MNSGEPEFLTSLISYIPELHPENLVNASNAYQYNRSTLATVPTLPAVSINKLSSQNRSIGTQTNTSEQVNLVTGENQPTGLVPSVSASKSFRQEAFKKQPEQRNSVKFVEANKTVSNNIITNPDVNTRVTYQRCKQVLGSLKKKKTVAFGSTVNISETIEGEDQKKKLTLQSTTNQKPLRMAGENFDELNGKIEILEKKVTGLNETIDDLKEKDAEKAQQILVLTEMVKKMTTVVFHKEAKQETVLVDLDDPPNSTSHNISKQTRDRETHKEEIAKDDWNIIKKKLEEDSEFRKYVDQGLMRYGGDDSLDVVARRAPLKSNRKETNIRSDPVVPVVKATQLMKEMTLQQVHRCFDSPPRSIALSYDTRMYLAKHGVISDDEYENDCENTENLRVNQAAPVCSVYQKGESTTYYSNSNKNRCALRTTSKKKNIPTVRCQCGIRNDVSCIEEDNDPDGNCDIVQDKRSLHPPRSVYRQGQSMTYYSANVRYVSPSNRKNLEDRGFSRNKADNYLRNQSSSRQKISNIGFQPDDFENDFEEHVDEFDFSNHDAEMGNVRQIERTENRGFSTDVRHAVVPMHNRNNRGHFPG